MCVCVASIGAGACARPTAEPAREQSTAPAQSQDRITLAEASRRFIEVEAVGAGAAGAVVSAPARVDFRDGAVSQVGSPLDGRVTDVHVLLGQRVSAGDPLVTIDAPEAADRRAAVAVSQASLREAQSELERQRRMQKEGVGIDRDLIAAETKVASGEADLSRVEAEAGSVGAGTKSALVVRAPINGVVISRKATVGLAVQRGGDVLVEIGDASAIWVVADVFERDLARVRVGSRAHVTFASAAREAAGRVVSVGAVVAANLRTAPVFLTLESSAEKLRPGMYGRVEIEGAQTGLTVPVSAVLIKDGKDPIVYVERDHLTFERRRVVVGPAVNGRVPILSGVASGEKVVVRGALLLDGSVEQLL
jgi:cobalt-zinc-cadmium efflux system membrane fusion protein